MFYKLVRQSVIVFVYSFSSSTMPRYIAPLIHYYANLIQQGTPHARNMAAFLLGACAALALPPLYLLPCVFVALTGLQLLVSSATQIRHAFITGWWWGFGYFLAGLYWIGNAIFISPEYIFWATPLILFVIPAYMALYVALPIAASYIARKRIANPLVHLILFSFFWVTSEYVRCHVFAGFTWNLIGYVWTFSPAPLQLAAISGIWGLSWLTILVGTMPSLMFCGISRRRVVLAIACLLTALFAIGGVRLQQNPTLYTSTTLRLVQANITQEPWSPEREVTTLRKYNTLTESPGLQAAQLVIWPESALGMPLSSKGRAIKELSALHLPEQSSLIFGAPRHIEKTPEVRNSMLRMDSQYTVSHLYDKRHLVPFGEFLPFRNILLFSESPKYKDYSAGDAATTLSLPGIPPFSPLMCYDVSYPGDVTDHTGRAQWLLALSNDAWFGITSGPYQHFQIARVRAIEEGLPLAYSDNIGVSAIVDAYGRVTKSLPLDTEGVLDSQLPQASSAPPLFSRYFFAPAVTMLAISLVALLLFIGAGNRKHETV